MHQLWKDQRQQGITVKLKDCTVCRLVKYCGVECQKGHHKQHKKACKQRAAELEEERLYSQGTREAGVGLLPTDLHLAGSVTGA